MKKENPDKSSIGGVGERIIEVAGEALFREGYHGLNMDRLAERLGMSKKTLYNHFSSKEEIMRTFMEGYLQRMQGRLERIMEEPGSTFPQRLRGVMEVVSGALRQVPPSLFSDLQRYAPNIYELMERVRSQLIPRLFGRLVREGQSQGHVRSEIDPDFAAYAWLQLVRGLVQPEALERTGLSAQQTVERAFGLFWPGLLTSEGRAAFCGLNDGRGKEADG